MEQTEKDKLIRLVTIVLFVLSFFSLLLGIYKGIGNGADFQWDSAKLLAMRIDPYEASLNSESPYHYSELGNIEANQFPSLLFFLFPYTFLDARAAVIAWLISNLIFAACIIVLLKKTYWKDIDSKYFYLLCAVFLSSGPLRNQVHLGQHTLFSFAFFLLAELLSQKEKPIASGLALAVSYFKYSITAPLMLYFLYKKRYKEIITSLSVHMVLTLFFSFWLGLSPVDLIILPLRQSTLLASAGFADLASILGSIGLSGFILTLPTILIFLFLGIWIMLGKCKLTDYGLLSILAIWSLVFMYHRRYDYFILLLPLATIFIEEREHSKAWNIWVYGILFLAFGILLIGNFIDLSSSLGQAVNRILSFLPYQAICKYLNIFLIITLYVILFDGYIVMRRTEK